MTFLEYKESLRNPDPPAGLAPALAALWWAAKDDWDKAHRLVMDEGGKDCGWVHAYLHRVEGDLDNAHYWYKQAGKLADSRPLSEEWEAIARVLLGER
jgi:hypothetical protein